MKTIVTHFLPDQDAICSIWLVKKFAKGWEDSEIAFVPAGKTLDDMAVDSDPDVLHVDTGFGKCDHHQSNEDTCAAILTWSWVKSQKDVDKSDNEAVSALVKVVNDVDHFREVYWPDPANDRYDFILERMIDGWKSLYPGEDLRLVNWGMDCLDGIFQALKNKLWAKKELENGEVFDTKWGKAVALETINDEMTHLGQKLGFDMVVRKDPRKGYLRIKILPKIKRDLSAVKDRLSKMDPKATWFLHTDGHQLLNGSTKNPDMKPTTLSLAQIVEVLKEIK